MEQKTECDPGTRLNLLINNSGSQMNGFHEMAHRLDTLANKLDCHNYSGIEKKMLVGQPCQPIGEGTILSKLSDQFQERDILLERMSMSINFLEQII